MKSRLFKAREAKRLCGYLFFLPFPSPPHHDLPVTTRFTFLLLDNCSTIPSRRQSSTHDLTPDDAIYEPRDLFFFWTIVTQFLLDVNPQPPLFFSFKKHVFFSFLICGTLFFVLSVCLLYLCRRLKSFLYYYFSTLSLSFFSVCLFSIHAFLF